MFFNRTTYLHVLIFKNSTLRKIPCVSFFLIHPAIQLCIHLVRACGGVIKGLNSKKSTPLPMYKKIAISQTFMLEDLTDRKMWFFLFLGGRCSQFCLIKNHYVAYAFTYLSYHKNLSYFGRKICSKSHYQEPKPCLEKISIVLLNKLNNKNIRFFIQEKKISISLKNAIKVTKDEKTKQLLKAK